MRDKAGGRRLGQRVLGCYCEELFGEMGTTGRQANCSWQQRRKRGGDDVFFGSEAGVVVTLASLSAVVASLSVAVPLVLSALSPGLVVVAPVTVSSPGWRNNQSGREKY